MKYEVRSATGNDVEFLPAIEQAASELFADTPFADETDQDCLTTEYLFERQQAGMLWVAALGDQVAGFAVAEFIGSDTHLHELSVHPQHQRKGLGRRLVEAVIERAKSDRCVRVTLSTYRDIPWNAPFYRKLGFAEVTELTEPYREIIDGESRRGLDASQRIIMELSI